MAGKKKTWGWWVVGGVLVGLIVIGVWIMEVLFVSTRGPYTRNASASLKTIATAQADFRSNDRDGNGVADYWTGDVAGLYCMTNANVVGSDDDPLKLIELGIAGADFAPLPPGGERAEIWKFTNRSPKAGYHYMAMRVDGSVDPVHPPELYQQNTGGKPDMGNVHHKTKFAFCTFPAHYGPSGTLTYILNESNKLYSRDTLGYPVVIWPSKEELRSSWEKVPY